MSQTLSDLTALAARHANIKMGVREAKLAKIISDGIANPDTVITTQGDIIVGNGAGNAARLAVGAANTMPISNGTTIAYSKASSASLTPMDHSVEGVNLLPKLAIVEYNFANDGGAQSTIDLGVTLPDNALVSQVCTEVVTAPTSAGSGGTIKLVLPTDGDLTANLTADGAAVSANTSNLIKKTTAARNLSVTIGTEALTAGRIRYHVIYFDSV